MRLSGFCIDWGNLLIANDLCSSERSCFLPGKLLSLAPPDSPRKNDILSFAIIGTAFGLTALFVLSYILWGRERLLGESLWFIPVMQIIAGFAALSLLLPDIPALVADRRQMGQLFVNLFNNAVNTIQVD